MLPCKKYWTQVMRWTSVLFMMMMACSGLAVIAADTNISSGAVEPAVMQRYTDSSRVLQICPNIVHHVFDGAMPRAGAKAGIIEEFPFVGTENPDIGGDLHVCIIACCERNQVNQTCNVVFVFKQKCYHVRCISNDACLPKKRSEIKDRLQMVLVSPVQQQVADEGVAAISWLDALKADKLYSAIDAQYDITEAAAQTNPLSFWKQPHKYHYQPGAQDPRLGYDEEDYPINEKRMRELLMSPMNEENNITPEDLSFYSTEPFQADSGASRFTPCSLDRLCGPNEKCVLHRTEQTTGVCQCIGGYVRNHARKCVKQDFDLKGIENDAAITESGSNVMMASTTPKDVLKKIVVSVTSKIVQLPEKEATLIAQTEPDEESANTKYTFLWTLVTQPKGPMNGTISDQSKSKVQLSNLSEGLYTFKVSVTGANGTTGEAMANVTVLPEKRINKVPQVIITPRTQTIRQPTTNAVLDGSTSTDDDKIVNWSWEVVSGPIGYQPKLPAVNTLQLTDLTSPGNYTFQLTVTDSNNVTNSSTANITVLKGTDYPPVANAGDAIILYLPNNNVTLNGSASSDDHEIVAWEWTKDASDESKAVDMQNTRTPYVQLSNLEEGMYTFMLKVVDGSGQSSSAKVHVFVKPQTNSPPVAAAGSNMTINLPRNWVLLNGTQSVDDIRIESYYWRQVAGPNSAIIKRSNASIVNATFLTLGLYEFKLFVVDENNNTANDSVWVKVIQEKNAAPVANAGGDQNYNLPVSAIYLNGTKSWDDLAVVNYTWSRDSNSLAMGRIIGETDKQPVLILSDLVQGRYVFKLTVTDEQGLVSTDTATIIVHPDPMLMNLVELTLSTGVKALTQSELDSVMQKISLLLGDMKMHVRDLRYDVKSEQAILIFYVEVITADQKSAIVNGLAIEQQLKNKFQRDVSILGTVFTDIRTTVCQNSCSGHGVCNPVTRACICEPFWMPSALFYWGVVEANCDWSILYVFVFSIVALFLLAAIFWGVACACSQTKKPRTRPKVQKYSLIGAQDEEAPQVSRTTSLTDSETDSDVLFETRSKPNGILRSNGAKKRTKSSNGAHSYNTSKMGRRIRT